jgi:hypothetical protein
MVAIESAFEIPATEDVYLVSQRKYNLDPSRPWRERVFFRYLFLPFVRFAFTHMHVPAIGAVEPDGTVVIIEQQRICTDRQAAEALCRSKDEFWSWKPLPLDVTLPDASVQHKGHRNPLSIVPDRYRRRTFPVATAPTHQMAQVKRNLERIIKTAAAT